MREFWIWNRQM